MLRITLVVFLSALVAGCDLAVPLLKTKMGESFDMVCELRRTVVKSKGVYKGESVLKEGEEDGEMDLRLTFTESGIVTFSKNGGNKTVSSGEAFRFDYKGIRVPFPMEREEGLILQESVLLIGWGLEAKWRMAARYYREDEGIDMEVLTETFGQCKIFDW